MSDGIVAHLKGLTLADLAGKISFSADQLAEISGVSRRQLAYWGQRGIIPADSRYSLEAVEKVVLIKRALDSGATLWRAIQLAERYLGDRRAREEALAHMSEDELRKALDDQLLRLQTLAGRLRDLLPIHTGIVRLMRLARELEQLELDDLLSRPTLGGSLPQQTRDLELAIGRLEELLHELETAVARA
ncbi:MAG: MerR family transcriptional regulator [Chloroflexi bacterium]|nr:MerR family transcriptional regulator [Chloroflexota bacterium]